VLNVNCLNHCALILGDLLWHVSFNSIKISKKYKSTSLTATPIIVIIIIIIIIIINK